MCVYVILTRDMHMKWNPFTDKIEMFILVLIILLATDASGVPFVNLVHGNVVHGSSTAT